MMSCRCSTVAFGQLGLVRGITEGPWDPPLLGWGEGEERVLEVVTVHHRGHLGPTRRVETASGADRQASSFMMP